MTEELEKSRRLTTHVMLALLVTVCLALLAYRIVVTSRTLYNSDAATLSVYAQEILRSHNLFPPGWTYNNGDVWLYNALIFIVPLITVFPNGYSVYAAATTLYACMMLFGIYIGARAMHVAHRAALLLVAIMATGIASPFLADLMYDWGANYGAEFFIAFVELVAFVRIMRWDEGQGRSQLYLSALLMGLTVFVGAISNSSRAIIYQCAPFVVSVPILWFLARRRPATAGISGRFSLTKWWALGLPLVVPFFFGSAINHWVTGGSTGLSAPHIYPANDLMQHLAMVCTSVLFMLGVPISTWSNLLGDVGQIPLLSFSGAWLCLRICIALALVWVVYRFVRRALLSKDLSIELSIYGLVAVAGLTMSLFIHVFAYRYPTVVLPNQPPDYESARYLFTPLMLVFIGSFFGISDRLERSLQSFNVVSFVGLFVLTLSWMNNVYPESVRSPSGSTELARADKDQIVECLAKAGLKYGYGNLWLSHVVTILSDSKIVVRPVLVEGAIIAQPLMHAESRWYEDASWKGQTFLILDSGDLLTAHPPWPSYGSKPIRQFLCGNNDDPTQKPGPVQIFVFPYNIGPRLSILGP